MVPDEEGQLVCSLDFAIEDQPVTLAGYIGDWQLWDIVTDFWRRSSDTVHGDFVLMNCDIAAVSKCG